MISGKVGFLDDFFSKKRGGGIVLMVKGVTNLNDFAHRAPGKMGPKTSPSFPTKKGNPGNKLLVKHPGYLPGVCGWDLR